ncbi:MAG TPA: iron chelate uptake ABC transporter family permease subunit [Clostridiaceae bacterium]
MFLKKIRINSRTYLIIFSLILLITIVLCSTIGAAKITFFEALYIIIRKLPVLNYIIPVKNISATHNIIVLNLRLPRIILAALIGFGLATMGCAFQAIFKNPMADPYVLGVSSGSALGAAIAIVIGIGYNFLGFGIITFSAFIGGILTTIMVYNIARVGNRIPTTTLLLAGISANFLLSSIITLLMVLNRQQADKIIFWTMGSVSSASWTQILSVFPFVGIGFIIMMIYSRDLNIILTGDAMAKSLGIEVDKVKKLLLIISSLVVGAIVAFSGIIGFVGLISPHVARMLVGPDHKKLIPFSAIGGAIFMVLADTLSRTIVAPAEIPIGAITSLIGAPYFIFLLMKTKKKVF